MEWPGTVFGRARRSAARLGVVALLALLSVLASGWWSPASAHAVLQSSTPADGSLLASSPPRVELRFNEHVTLTIGSVRVYDRAGHRVDDGNVGHGRSDSVVTVGLKPRLSPGTYVVAWHVISADTHPVHGGLLFSVKTRQAVKPGLVAGLANQSGSSTWQIVGGVLRWVTYAAAFLAAGAAVFLAFVADDEDRRRTPRRLVTGAGIAAVVGALLQLPQQAALATGLGVGAIAHHGVFGKVLGDGVGPATVLTIAGAALAIGAVLVGRRARRQVLALVALGALTASFDVAGHSRTTDPVWLAVTADAVHVAAAAVWAGGLVLLALALRTRFRARTDPVGTGRLVARFSSVATVAILAVLVAGVILAWREVRALDALTSTTYGVLLLVKVGVVALIAMVAAFNHYRLVPNLKARPDNRSAWQHLGRTLRAEVFGIAVVLALTAALVNTIPAHTALGIGRVYSTTASLGQGAGSINVVVDPTTPGPGQIHLYTLDSYGRPNDRFRSIQLQFSLPSQNVGPIERTPFKAGPGHFQLNRTPFTLTGTWTVTVELRVDKFTVRDAVFRVHIHG